MDRDRRNGDDVVGLRGTSARGSRAARRCSKKLSRHFLLVPEQVDDDPSTFAELTAMMFRLGSADGYEWVLPLDTDHETAFGQLDGSPRGDRWSPINVYRTRADERQPARPADFPGNSRVLVMRQTVLDVMSDILTASGEVLPLKDSGGVALWVFNARVAPVLDESRSEIWRFKDGRIMYVKSPVLFESGTNGLDIFRVYPLSGLFVTDRFVTRVKEHHLSGLQFEAVPTTRPM